MIKVNLYAKYSAVINSILLASMSALGLYLLRYIATGIPAFSFMAWNLVLSLLALLAAVVTFVSSNAGNRMKAIVSSVVWLLLLPNTFYMLTDFIHIKDTGDITIMYDIIMIGLFAMNGFLHGLISLCIIHKLIVKRLSKLKTAAICALIILLASFAVDMGRYLRWNSWDVVLHPAALLFDISDILLHPFANDRSFVITGVLFITISSLYAVVWQLSALKWGKHAKH